MSANLDDTIAALATPSGESALAVVRVSGPQCVALVHEIFDAAPLPRSAVHADYRDADGTLVDDVLYTFFAGPNSYTGEDTLEISGHGNPYIAQRLLEDLWARGCRPAGPGEFTQRAFVNGRMDLSQAEAVMDLIHARSEAALAAANRQLRGGLGRRIAGLIDQLVRLVAQVEAYLDFPEEDLPAADRAALRDGLATLQAEIGRLLAAERYGALLRDGVRTVLVGETNVGKSSLLNRLLGWERALVSPQPGTTRDFLEEARLVGPHCVRYIDTAGLNPAADGLEAQGIARTLERTAAADLVLLVLDATRPAPALPPALAARLHYSDTVVVWNKTDLAPPGPVPPAWAECRTVAVSARDGRGLPDLEAAIGAAIDAHRREPAAGLVAINARHAHDLRRAQEALAGAATKLTGGADELLAADLRAALDALGQIGGRVDNERILDALFATFCIGK